MAGFDKGDFEGLLDKLVDAIELLPDDNKLSAKERLLLISIFAAAGRSVDVSSIDEESTLRQQLRLAFEPAQGEFTFTTALTVEHRIGPWPSR